MSFNFITAFSSESSNAEAELKASVLADLGILETTSVDDSLMTRGEFAFLASKMLGINEFEFSSSFIDTEDSEYGQAVAAICSSGYMSGYGDGTFGIDDAKDTYKNAKDNRMGRYVAVNLENDNTIEFRLFRGTLRYITFAAALELVYEICRFAIMLTDNELENMSWNDFVSKIDPNKKELLQYLKEKNLIESEAR